LPSTRHLLLALPWSPLQLSMLPPSLKLPPEFSSWSVKYRI
jgi:hypothetical protein